MSTIALVLLLLWHGASAQNYSQYVDVFIGTEGSEPGTSYNGGNVFPGASLPFGGVKVGIDTTEYELAAEAVEEMLNIATGSTARQTPMQVIRPMATSRPLLCCTYQAPAAPPSMALSHRCR